MLGFFNLILSVQHIAIIIFRQLVWVGVFAYTCPPVGAKPFMATSSVSRAVGASSTEMSETATMSNVPLNGSI